MRVPLLLSLLLVVGCARYEYDLVRPPEIAKHIGTKDDLIVTLDPFEYRFRSYENYLVIRVYNPSDEPIQLLGEQSSVVDPGGQSHPLRSATIESHSFVKLILPPAPGYVAPAGPVISIGVGASAQAPETDRPVYLMTHGHYHHRRYYGRYGYWGGYGYYDPWFYDYYAPRYYVLYDQSVGGYWEWKGETDVRMAMAFERNGKTFRDEFVFHRVKVK